jgi:hypothetical protein
MVTVREDSAGQSITVSKPGGLETKVGRNGGGLTRLRGATIVRK